MRHSLPCCSHGATGNCSPCSSIATPSGDGLKSHRAFLAPRMPEAKWLRECSPYVWPLWRNWKPPKPMKVETAADVTRRLLAYKPAGRFHSYGWKVKGKLAAGKTPETFRTAYERAGWCVVAA